MKVQSSLARVEPGSAAAILPAAWRDLNPIRHLEKVCFPVDAWPFLDLLAALSLPGMVRLKAVIGDQLVGFILGEPKPLRQMAWIATIAVLPEYRGRGIGSSLLVACEAALTQPRIRLSVRASNEIALKMYTTFHYHQVGLWPRYFRDGEDAIVMEKLRD